MDFEGRLRQLEYHYRRALSSAVAAKANYLAVAGQPGTLPPTIARAQEHWQQLDELRRGIAHEMAALEELEDESTT